MTKHCIYTCFPVTLASDVRPMWAVTYINEMESELASGNDCLLSKVKMC